MFHDSVDVMLDSKEFPLGFNIFDFNGISNLDPLTIELLIKSIPNSLILVQVSSKIYIENFLSLI